ncbi:hypothetical protein KSS87_012682 [Heliosperma pusillum]|nr:hypothetical protein KSS87_012682 [Heliosperma pusillum]
MPSHTFSDYTPDSDDDAAVPSNGSHDISVADDTMVEEVVAEAATGAAGGTGTSTGTAPETSSGPAPESSSGIAAEASPPEGEMGRGQRVKFPSTALRDYVVGSTICNNGPSASHVTAPSPLSGTPVQFTEYVQKNVALYQFKNGIPLTTAATANFTRGELATALRKNPYSVNILLAGFDKETGPSLYFIDYIATLHKVDKAAFGYGAYFSLSMMDRHYHSGMSVEEAADLVNKCILEIRSRLVVAPPNFVIKIVDKDGAREYAWCESIKDQSAVSA